MELTSKIIGKDLTTIEGTEMSTRGCFKYKWEKLVQRSSSGSVQGVPKVLGSLNGRLFYCLWLMHGSDIS